MSLFTPPGRRCTPPSTRPRRRARRGRWSRSAGGTPRHPAPATTTRVSDVRSNIADALARRAVLGGGLRSPRTVPAQPVRAADGSGGFVPNHCARSQPLPSKNSAPSSSSRSWNGGAPQRPRDAQRLERMDEVVHLVVVARAAGPDVGAAWSGPARTGARSSSWTSIPGSPSVTQSAISRPPPPPWVSQIASANHAPADRRGLAHRAGSRPA